MSDEVRVVVVDHSPFTRLGIAIALERTGRFQIVGEAGTAAEALALLARVQAHVATVDILLPDESGLSLTSDLYDLQPECRVIGVSVIDEPGLIADMLRAHGCGYVIKSQPLTDLAEALDTVLSGRRYLPPTVPLAEIEAELVESTARPLARLTTREREVFELLIRGFTNEEIASRLQIARRTVDTHRQRITHKLSTHSIPELQRLAARHNGLGQNS